MAEPRTETTAQGAEREAAEPAEPQPAWASQQALIDAASRMGVGLDAAGAGKLLGYLAMLRRWNQVYNLSAIRDPGQMWAQHLLDCLAIVPEIDHQFQAFGTVGTVGTDGTDGAVGRVGAHGPLRADAGCRILDVGSGAGLPGVVLAVVRPDWRIDCIDTVGKKASFIRQVGIELALPNLRACHGRVEAWSGASAPPPVPPRSGQGYDLITSRAFASLRDFTGWTRHLLAPQGVWLAMKGQHPVDELAELGRSLDVFHVKHLTIDGLPAQRCLVWMRPAAMAHDPSCAPTAPPASPPTGAPEIP